MIEGTEKTVAMEIITSGRGSRRRQQMRNKQRKQMPEEEPEEEEEEEEEREDFMDNNFWRPPSLEADVNDLIRQQNII